MVHGAGGELEADDALHRSRRIRSRDGTGVEDGHARSTGMSGTTAEGKGARERIKDIGIKGRLRKACQGQADGSSVRRRSYILMDIIIDDFKCVFQKRQDVLFAKKLMKSISTISSAKYVYACTKQ